MNSLYAQCFLVGWNGMQYNKIRRRGEGGGTRLKLSSEQKRPKSIQTNIKQPNISIKLGSNLKIILILLIFC